MKQRALRILWPAFLVAAGLDAMVFAVVDPGELRWFGGELLGWPPAAIYSVTFVIFWVALAVSGAMTALLLLRAEDVNRLDRNATDAVDSTLSTHFETSVR